MHYIIQEGKRNQVALKDNWNYVQEFSGNSTNDYVKHLMKAEDVS